MADITEQPPISPVQPVTPGRPPAQRRRPQRRPDKDEPEQMNPRDPDEKGGHVLDEYA